MQNQSDWHSLAATQLDDPLMLEWALDYYHDLPAKAPLREALLATWFHDINLRRWLGGSDAEGGNRELVEARNQLIRALPVAAFANVASMLTNAWRTWSVDALDPITALVATLDPERAAEVFSAYLKQPSSLGIERVAAIAEHLDKLPEGLASPIFEQLLRLADTDQGKGPHLLQQSLFKAAVKLNRSESLPRLFKRCFSESRHRQQFEVEVAAEALFGHASFARACFWRSSDDDAPFEAPSFVSLAPLFEHDAPLAEINAAVAAKAPLPLALALLETHCKHVRAAGCAHEIIKQCQAAGGEKAAIALSALALAAVASAFERPSIEVGARSVDEVFGLLTINVDTNIHYAALLEAARGLPKSEVVEAANRHLTLCRGGNGGIAVARLMGDLGWSEFVPPLLACIDDDSGDFLCEAAQDALVEIGEPARDELIARWDELDDTQHIYGASALIQIGGRPVADFVLGHSDKLLKKGAETWCRFVLAAPDSRLVELVRAKLPLDHPLINEAAYCLLRLLDSSAPELPVLREKIMLRRARQQRRRSAQWGLDDSPSEKPELELRCIACGEINLYDVEQVLVDPTPGNMAYLIADEFPCKACGKTADFELETSARMVLLAETIGMLGDADAGVKAVTPRVAQLKVRTSDGSAQSVNAAFRQLQENVRKNPGDWLSWHRLSNINATIKRPAAALKCALKAYALNPLLIEIIYNAGARLQEAGQSRDALDLLDSALQRVSEWTSQSIYLEQEGLDFAELYNELRQKTGRTYLPALHPRFIAGHPNLAAVKVGRNDPCPCGSGKKYKKCCMP